MKVNDNMGIAPTSYLKFNTELGFEANKEDLHSEVKLSVCPDQKIMNAVVLYSYTKTPGTEEISGIAGESLKILEDGFIKV